MDEKTTSRVKRHGVWTFYNKNNQRTYINSKFRLGSIDSFARTGDQEYGVSLTKMLLRTAAKWKEEQLSALFHYIDKKTDFATFLERICENPKLSHFLILFKNKLYTGEYKAACSVASKALEELENLRAVSGAKEKRRGSYILDDYLAITSSSAFRRLQDKAQVYSLESRDFARSRLTHSLEVAANCERIVANIDFARALGTGASSIGEDCCYAVRCAGLLHDIGNPPFGHYGEAVIRSFFREKKNEKRNRGLIKKKLFQDFTDFDGNAQALRIVTKLQYFGEQTNLNLTACVLGAMIKYPFSSTNNYGKEKFGYYQSELEVAELLKASGVLVEFTCNPLSLILEASDDISYATADLEDAIHKGLLSFESFEMHLKPFLEDPHVSLFFDTLKKAYQNEVGRYPANGDTPGAEGLQQALEHASRSVLSKYRDIFLKSAANRFVIDRKLILVDGVRRATKEDEYSLMGKSEHYKLFDLLKKLTASVYSSREITCSEIKGQRILHTIMDAYYEALVQAHLDLDNKAFGWPSCEDSLYFQHLMTMVSPDFIRNMFDEISNAVSTRSMKLQDAELFYKYHLLLDFISGMTDSYAKTVFEVITGK